MKKTKTNQIIFQAITCVYFILSIFITVNLFLYNITITNKFGFFLLFLIFNGAFVPFMLKSRETTITKIISCILPFTAFLALIFDFGEIAVFFPMFAAAVVVFFCSKCGDMFKTILGTLYLLLYVIGTIIFLLSSNFVKTGSEGIILSDDINKNSELSGLYTQQAVDKVNKNNVSPDGKLKFYITDRDNSMYGMVELYVIPNEKEKSFAFFEIRQKGCEKRVGYVRGRGNDQLPEVSWMENNKIKYKFPGQSEKHSVISKEDIKKDYFSFLS